MLSANAKKFLFIFGCFCISVFSGSLFAQSAAQMSAHQFSQIYGWKAGNPRVVDMVSELTPSAYAAFWTMDQNNRQIVFNTFSWNVIEAMVNMQMNEITAPAEPKKRLAQPRIRNQYESLIDLVANRFDITIRSTDLYSGLMYLMDLNYTAGTQHFLTIFSLVDNIDMLKPKASQAQDNINVNQRMIKVSPNGNVFYTDLHSTPELTSMQRIMRDFLFR